MYLQKGDNRSIAALLFVSEFALGKIGLIKEVKLSFWKRYKKSLFSFSPEGFLSAFTLSLFLSICQLIWKFWQSDIELIKMIEDSGFWPVVYNATASGLAPLIAWTFYLLIPAMLIVAFISAGYLIGIFYISIILIIPTIIMFFLLALLAMIGELLPNPLSYVVPWIGFLAIIFAWIWIVSFATGNYSQSSDSRRWDDHLK